jgi:DNA-binding SARP family transcriptional activator
MSPRLQVRLLGQFEATLDERPLTKLIGGRLQSLFAYLVLHGGAPQSRSHLAFQFWPDAVESNARNNLRQLLHQLREALREAGRFVRTTPSSVQWEPAEPCVVDVTAMTAALCEADEAGRSGDALRGRSALGRAVDLCGGPLVPSCYDDSIVPERDRLARRCIETIAQLVKLFEATREYQLAIPYVYHWLRHDPTDEEAYRQLMRLCALAHDRGAALRAFRDCRQTLQRELGTEPSEETLRLHELIERADRTIGGARGAEGPSLPLIGRNEAFLALRKAWDAAAVGAARFVLITGEAGIGKSRLATELVSWARLQGIATATTRCYAAEGRLALAPVTDWLRSEALAQSDEARPIGEVAAEPRARVASEIVTSMLKCR